MQTDLIRVVENLRKTFATPGLKFALDSHPLCNLFPQRTFCAGEFVEVSLETIQQKPQGNADRTPPTDLGACVAGLVNVVAKGMANLVAPHDLIPLEFALLRAFLRQEEWTTTQLARVLPVRTSRISRVVTKLVDRGLMSRRRMRNDRRVVILTLTEEGKALTRELHRRVQAYDTELSEGVTEQEMAALASATSKIMANYTTLARG